MATFEDVLRLLVSRRPSAVAAASPTFISRKSLHQNAHHGNQSEDSDTAIIGPIDMIKEATGPLLLETKYGLRLEATDRHWKGIKVTFTSHIKEHQQQYTIITAFNNLRLWLARLTKLSPASDQAAPERLHYRLFADYCTSFLWNDMSYYTGNPHSFQPHVDEDIIQARYPALWPYYNAWVQEYNDNFKQNELDLGSHTEVFEDVETETAWHVEGLLMACWLVLQEDVGSVEYSPHSAEYLLKKATIETELPMVFEGIVKEAEQAKREAWPEKKR